MSGENVKYFDIFAKEELEKRAREIGYDYENIPTIDFVEPSGDLSIIKEKFDVIISSHNIEHCLDLIAHLQHIEKLLSEDGKYILIIPDKRYTFDHYLPLTTIDQIVASNYNKRDNHSLLSMIQHRALTTHNNPIQHWNRQSRFHKQKDILVRIKEAIAEWEEESSHYIDVHAWYFVPESFRQNISFLNEMNYISLAPERVYATPRGRAEFVAVLGFSDCPAAEDREPVTDASLYDNLRKRYDSLQEKYTTTRKKLSTLQQEHEVLQAFYENILHSTSYSIGSKITLPLRKLKKMFSGQ